MLKSLGIVIGLAMQAKQDSKITKKEFERLSAEIRELVGNKLKGHKDGDAEASLE
jgi:hypothetical protein